MAKGNHSFTERDIRQRFDGIVGHTVAEVDTAGILTASSASRNKGRIGAIIEQSVLGYPADSDRGPDIVIDGQPWEVKATGLVEGTRGGWRAKEPMSITAVAPEGIVAESFTTSAFWHKAERLLVVYYLYVRPGKGVAVEYAGFEFKGYDLHTWREVDRCRLEADWTVVREFVRTALEGDIDSEMPNLSTLVNPQLLYLDTSPKWPNRPRFRLKASLVTQIARERLDEGMHMIPDQGGLSSMGALRVHLHGLSDTYAGQTLEDLAAVLTGVAIPFCDFSPELWGHELSLILAVILGKVALESYLGELLVNLFQLIERHGFQIFSHRDGIGIPCIVNLLIPRLLSGQDELKFIIVIDGAIELSLPPFPEPRPIDLGLRCFLPLLYRFRMPFNVFPC